MSQTLPATIDQDHQDRESESPSAALSAPIKGTLSAVRKVAAAAMNVAAPADAVDTTRPTPPARYRNKPVAGREFSTARLDDIHPGSLQTRRIFTEDNLRALTQSIVEKGIAQPLIVRRQVNSGNGYDLIAGYRRWRAARLAGLEQAPVVILDIVEDDEALEFALIENLQRRDLTLLEEAQALQLLIDRHDRTHSQIAILTGRSRSHVTNMLRLLTLPPEIKDMLDAGEIGFGHARALLTAREPVKLAKRVARSDLRVRDVERIIAKEQGRDRPSRLSSAAAPTPNRSVAATAPAQSTALVETDGELTPQRRALENELSELLAVDVEISLTSARPSVVLQADSIGQIFEAIRLIKDGVRTQRQQRMMDKTLDGDSII